MTHALPPVSEALKRSYERSRRLHGPVDWAEVPKTRPVSKWTGFKKLRAPALPSRAERVPRDRRPAKLDRNGRARMARLLETYNRTGRQKLPSGRTDQGPLKASGVDVGKELLFGFLNVQTGQLDPSDKTVAAETGWSVRTIARARERLRASGLLSWFRRSKWTVEGWKPTSNVYTFGHSGRQTTSRNIKLWGEKVAASPPEPLLTLLSAPEYALALTFGY